VQSDREAPPCHGRDSIQVKCARSTDGEGTRAGCLAFGLTRGLGKADLNALESKIRPRLAKRIHELRKAREYSQEELAQRAGISISYLSMIERGKRVPSIGTLAVLASVLGVSLSEMFRDVG
jgi:DNA-binding XRE family transcriptional regulator